MRNIFSVYILYIVAPMVVFSASIPLQVNNISEINNSLPHVYVSYCPDIRTGGEWYLRAVLRCYNTENYHCLQSTDHRYIELCMKVEWIEQEIKKCPGNSFEPYGRWSNVSQSCDWKKSLCNGIGEVPCNNGNNTSDRLCRCDYEHGWGIEQSVSDNQHNTSCVFPRRQQLNCVRKICEKWEELDPAYQCVNICRDGYFRPTGSFHCVQGNKHSFQSVNTTDSIQNTTATNVVQSVIQIMDGGSSFQKNIETFSFPIALTIVLVFTFASVLWSICKRNTGLQKRLMKLANQKMFERSYKKRQARKIENNKKRQEHKAHLNKKVEKTMSKNEEKKKKIAEKKEQDRLKKEEMKKEKAEKKEQERLRKGEENREIAEKKEQDRLQKEELKKEIAEKKEQDRIKKEEMRRETAEKAMLKMEEMKQKTAKKKRLKMEEKEKKTAEKATLQVEEKKKERATFKPEEIIVESKQKTKQTIIEAESM